MKTSFLKKINTALLVISIFATGALPVLTSCEEEEVKNDSVVLLSYGPMPVPRGGELRFIGKNLDKVASIVLPGGIEITDFQTKSPTLITIIVPQNAVEGLVTVKYKGGEITTKTPIGFLETIALSDFSPKVIKADGTLTITGDYLNLIKEVIFTDRVSVSQDDFVSQSRSELKVKVPAAARTGKIAISNGAEDPIVVYSEQDLDVKLPAIAEITPNPVKAGTKLVVKGTDLDLVEKIVFGGSKTVAEFDSQSETQIEVTVPDDAQDGKIIVLPASEAAVESASALVMMVPTVTVSPTAVKNGGTITVTGSNLDLIDKIIFHGDFEGEKLDGGSDSEIKVVIPDQALSGVVRFVTKAEKEVAGPSLTMVSPVFASFTPGSLKPKNNITIAGSNLDLVADVIFADDISGTIGTRSETELTVTVPVGAKSGKVILVAKNGVTVESPSELTVLSNLPTFDSFSETKGAPGKILTINGTSLLLIKELVFPGEIYATAYGVKSDIVIEVYVPENVGVGMGSIRMITYEGEEGLLPEIFFGGVDPVYNEDLCFFNFNNTGKDSWWGGAIGSGIETDPASSADGTPYWRVNGMSGNGWWDGLFFRNGDNNFVTTGVDPATWAVRFDLNTFEDFPTEGDLRIRLGNYFFYFNLNRDMGLANTHGWLTITAPLSGFKNDSGATITNPADGGAEFGMIWSSGTSVKLNIGIDNVRFEPIP